MDKLIPWHFALVISIVCTIVINVFVFKLDPVATYMILSPPVLLLLFGIYGESYRRQVGN